MADINLADYYLNKISGVITPLPDSLPDYFKPWDELVRKIPEYVEKKIMRQETEKLPQLDSSKLQDFGELRLAHLQLCYITAWYVWQDGKGVISVKSIPANIAVPFCDVCDRTGLNAGPSIASFYSNFELIDKNGPYTRDNFRLRYNVPGGEKVVRFWQISYEIESNSGRLLLPPLLELIDALRTSDEAKSTAALKGINEWLLETINLCKLFPGCIEPIDFFIYIGTLADGFNDYTGYPDGMLFEGVKNNPQRKSLTVSLAQSVTFPVVERLLGIEFTPEQSAVKKSWRDAWLSPYQRFYNDIIDKTPRTVKDLVDANPNSELAQIYNEFLKNLYEFRSYHMQLATIFYVIPNQKVRAEKQDTSADQVGAMMQGLKDFRQVADSFKVNEVASQ